MLPAEPGWLAEFESEEPGQPNRFLAVVGWCVAPDGHAAPLVICPDGIHSGCGGLDFVAASHAYEWDQDCRLVGVAHEGDR